MSIQENSYYIQVAAYINACIEMLESMIQLNRLGYYQTVNVKPQSQAIGSAVTRVLKLSHFIYFRRCNACHQLFKESSFVRLSDGAIVHPSCAKT